jgi:hypothetical protein
MRYLITMMSGKHVWLTEKEVKTLRSIRDKKGLVYVPSIDKDINLSSVETIEPANAIDKSSIKVGFLKDGTKVIRKRGSWAYAFDPNRMVSFIEHPEVIKDDVYISLEEVRATNRYLLQKGKK